MRPVLSFFKPVAAFVFIALIAANSLFAQDLTTDEVKLYEAGKVKLTTVHKMLVDVVQDEETLYKLRERITDAKPFVAPHFPVRVDDPNLTPEQALQADHENMYNWITSYPHEVSNYTSFVYEVINTYTTERSKK